MAANGLRPSILAVAIQSGETTPQFARLLCDLEFVAQGDRVLVVGFATGKVKATNRTFEDYFVFAITVRNGKLTNIREYVDTQALARASEMSLGNEEIIRELYAAAEGPGMD